MRDDTAHEKIRGNARDAIRTHEPLQERILSPSELAGLSYPRALNYYPSGTKKNPIHKGLSVAGSSGMRSAAGHKGKEHPVL